MWHKAKNIAIYILLLIVGAFCGFWIFDRIAMPAVIGSGEAYPIPNLVGMTADAAEQRAISDGFRFKVVRYEFSTTVPANRVLSQIPNAQSLAKKGRQIRVIVSKGGIKAIVPDVSKELLRQAQIEIEQARLVVDTVYEQFSDSVEAGRVIAISPPAGETLAAGDGVKLVVSLGSEKGIVTVPNLVGMQSADACKILHQLRLKCLQIKRRIPTIANGEVFKQEPAPGTKVYRGNAVRIMVNQLE